MSIKYVFITGGVLSSLGKGITASFLGTLLESLGFKIALLKLDPYLNMDPGTMNPFQHGEVYVTEDGAETDLDLGHYYRFTNSPLNKYSSISSGQIYYSVLAKEREGKYLGQTVQVIPHITEEIKERIKAIPFRNPEVEIVLCEIGGTVGDIESLPFLEAIRQFRREKPGDCANLHLTYVPFLKAAKELKTKPTQHSVQSLRQIGIIPDLIFCRSEGSLEDSIKEKISLFCNVGKEAVIDQPDVSDSIYEVALSLQRQKVGEKLCTILNISPRQKGDLSAWQALLQKKKRPKSSFQIGLVGKYFDHADAYKSLSEALSHAALQEEIDLKISYIDSEEIEESQEKLEECNGILVLGGFGLRGFSGKIKAAQYCRENKVPYFGICLGMQALIVEFGRNVVGLQEAQSSEMNPHTKNPVIHVIEKLKEKPLGGTMRLGNYPCSIQAGSLAEKIYQKRYVQERHRHRYEFNNQYRKLYEEKGAIFSGIWEEGNLVEIIELNHPWMIGVQYHPEFISKPLAPHPLFVSFLKASLKKALSKKRKIFSCQES